MSTTCRDVIKRALRMLGVADPGLEPRADELNDALDSFQAMYGEWLAAEKFGPLADVIISADYTAGENERIANDGEVQYAITFPETVEDTDANGATYERQPKDRAVVLISGSTPQAFMYDRDLASWIDVLQLDLTDPAPLATRYGTGLAASLAVRLAPEYSRQPSAVVVAMAAEAERVLSFRQFGRAAIDPALWPKPAFDITTG